MITNQIKILIADDHPLFRNGLKQIIQGKRNYNIVGEAEDGEEALAMIIDQLPDIAILDLDMPKLNGLQIVKKLLAKNISTKIIFLTMHNAEELLHEALKLKVKGYVLKENALFEILKAIDKVSAGDNYICSEMMESLIEQNLFTDLQNPNKLLISKLTQTERIIIKMISQQKTSKTIADELSISYKTVEKHRSNICDKLNLSGNNALLKFSIEHKNIV
jgi:DNA-binding NarL/FixJ family response regulator